MSTHGVTLGCTLGFGKIVSGDVKLWLSFHGKFYSPIGLGN